jgi:mono/diheme cytochrome c family protein
MNFFSRFLNGQMIFERIETRILVGIVMFVATMILIGWVAINEGSRMLAFDRQYLSRSIERGGELYTTNCATCHGPNGYGISGRAPGLNNPQLFGHDFIPEINQPRDALLAEKGQLENELNDVEEPPTEERRAEIEARLAEIDIEVADLEQQAQPFLFSVQQAMSLGYDPYRPSRLTNTKWGSTLFNFVYSTLVHGRPIGSAYWENGTMPNWAQVSGGPLRNDQIIDLTNYILNWNREFTVEDLLLVQQFMPEPCVPGTCPGTEGAETVGTDVAAVIEQLATVTGDPARGDALYHGQTPPARGLPLGCAGCHAGGQAPVLEGTWTRVLNERLPALPVFESGEAYLVSSILRPGDYVVETYSNIMPATFGNQLSLQDIADLIAYLMQQNQ